jgi:molecular chaperone GrpE
LEQEIKLAKDEKKKPKPTPKDSPEKKAKSTETQQICDVPEPAGTEDISSLKEQLSAEKDRILRLSAEFDNYKKRKEREITEFRKFANEAIFRQILSVVDNLERAISSVEANADESGLLEGVKLIYKELLQLFETFNVKLVKAENEPFDPNFHQAVTREETDEIPENTVTTVLQKGYLLHDRLIRPAMVVVSKKVETETETNKEN